MNTWIPIKFYSYSTSHSKVPVCFISQYFLWNQYIIPLQTLELHRISSLTPFCKAFIKIYYIPKFHCHILGHSKVTCYSFFHYINFFTICHYISQTFIATSLKYKATEIVRTVLRSFSENTEDTTVTANFLKSHICNTSCTEINTLLAIFSNKGLSNLKVRPNHSIFKGIDAG